ncbi:hypothetical protein MJO29_001492 [Puccinia striiformis f. sp. tritici]|nr:hypothetical protein MJO29_001492 [Puccinia striiformis f. sp. tritici]
MSQGAHHSTLRVDVTSRRIKEVFKIKRPPSHEESVSYTWPGCEQTFHEDCIVRRVAERRRRSLCPSRGPHTMPYHICKKYEESLRPERS